MKYLVRKTIDGFKALMLWLRDSNHLGMLIFTLAVIWISSTVGYISGSIPMGIFALPLLILVLLVMIAAMSIIGVIAYYIVQGVDLAAKKIVAWAYDGEIK